MAGLPQSRVPVRDEGLRLETAATFSEAVLKPFRRPGVPPNIAPPWPS
jgi:hypothetical protein